MLLDKTSSSVSESPGVVAPLPVLDLVAVVVVVVVTGMLPRRRKSSLLLPLVVSREAAEGRVRERVCAGDWRVSLGCFHGEKASRERELHEEGAKEAPPPPLPTTTTTHKL